MLTALLVPRLIVIDGVIGGIGNLFLQHRKALRLFQIKGIGFIEGKTNKQTNKKNSSDFPLFLLLHSASTKEKVFAEISTYLGNGILDFNCKIFLYIFMECYMEKKPGHSSACNTYISKGSFLQGFLKLDTQKKSFSKI